MQICTGTITAVYRRKIPLIASNAADSGKKSIVQTILSGKRHPTKSNFEALNWVTLGEAGLRMYKPAPELSKSEKCIKIAVNKIQ
jgi:hypothetical protein